MGVVMMMEKEDDRQSAGRDAAVTKSNKLSTIPTRYDK